MSMNQNVQWVGNLRRASVSPWVLLTGVLAVALTMPCAVFSQEPSSPEGATAPTQAVLIGPPAQEEGNESLSWEMRPGRSYLIPALEIPAYIFLLNMYDRHFTEPTDEYRTNGNTIRTHLTDSRWVLDNDQFSVNQFLHPYGGTVYYGLARSAHLNFWESFLYAGAGSLIWEIVGEKTPPLSTTRSRPVLAGHSWASRSSEWPIYY